MTGDDDGPLTDIEQAVVEALAAVIVEEILEAEARPAHPSPDGSAEATVAPTLRRIG